MKIGNPENMDELKAMVNDFHPNALPEIKLIP